MKPQNFLTHFLKFVSLCVLFVDTSEAQNFNCDLEENTSRCAGILGSKIGEKRDYNTICREFKEYSSCIQEYHTRCTGDKDASDSKDGAPKYIPENMWKLCSDEVYRADYLKYSSCHIQTVVSCKDHLKEAQIFLSQGAVLKGSSAVDKIRELETICGEMVDYMACFRSKARSDCDSSAAATFSIRHESLGARRLVSTCDPQKFHIIDAADSGSTAITNRFTQLNFLIFFCAMYIPLNWFLKL